MFHMSVFRLSVPASVKVACVAIFLGISSQACVVSTGPEGTLQDAAVDGGPHCRLEADLTLQGVTCPSCREVVAASLLALPGVISADVSLSPPNAHVVYCDSLDESDLTRAVSSAGYNATVAK